MVKHWGAELVGLLLFGSAARGDATEGSDIDLLMVLSGEVQITRACYGVWDDFRRRHAGVPDLDRISPHFVHLPQLVQNAGGLWFEVSLDGIILWERGCQLRRFLVSVRRAMAQGKIRRRLLHGSPYWIKNLEERNA